jgi:predicted dehydrogenase
MNVEKIIIVGLGSIGRRHLTVIRDHFPDICIAALRREYSDSNEINALGLYDSFTSMEEALAFMPQAAIIANPSSKHVAVAKQLANAGIHLLIEKPIANSSHGVKELIDICIKKKVVLLTGYNLRYLPSLIKFREQIKQNKIGKISLVQSEVGQYLPSWRPGSDYRKTVSAQKSLGGGVLTELSHEIDYIHWVFGPIKWVKSHVSKQSDLEIDVEDTASLILGFDKTMDSGLIASLNMNFIQHDNIRQCKAIGENGSLLWDGISGEVKYFSKGGEDWELLFSSKPKKNFTYMTQLKHFFSLVGHSSSSISSWNDGLNHVVTIEAIRKSHIENRTIYL